MKTKEAIDQYIRRKGYDHGDQPIRALVAFSGTVSDPEAKINGFSASELPKKFYGDDYQVLVVAEKYQTGFDEPLLHTMYVDKKLAGVKAVQTLSRLNRTAPGKEDTFVLDTAQVLSESEVDAAVTALLSDDPARRGEVYRNLDFAKDRWTNLDDEEAEEFRAKLNHFCRAYSFLSQVMPFIDPSLERLYLYGKLLLTQLPTGEHDLMPQLSNEVLLTHLRMSVTGETDIQLEAGDQTPGTVLPGEGLGSKSEPVTGKLSALIEVMNEKFGADLDESDKLVFEQTRMDIMRRDDLRIIAKGNDREHYQLALADVVDDIFLSGGNRNAQIVEAYYAHPEIRDAFIDTWKEFRAEHE